MGQQEGGSAQSKRRTEDLPGVDEGRVEGAAADLLVADDPAAHVEDQDPKGLHLEASQLGREQPNGVRGPADMGPTAGPRPLHFSTQFEHRGEPLRLGSSQSALRREARRPEPGDPGQSQVRDRMGQGSLAALGEPTCGATSQARRPRRGGPA